MANVAPPCVTAFVQIARSGILGSSIPINEHHVYQNEGCLQTKKSSGKPHVWWVMEGVTLVKSVRFSCESTGVDEVVPKHDCNSPMIVKVVLNGVCDVYIAGRYALVSEGNFIWLRIYPT